ncbi:MAG: hypothetical protein U0R72_12850 [Nakamurella multipartita]
MPSLLLYLGIGLVLGVDTSGIDLDNTLLIRSISGSSRWSSSWPKVG